MNRLGASSPTKALRRGGGSGGHVSDVVDVRENKSTNPATMAMHRLTMSLGSWPSSNCCCHPFQTDGLHHLVQKGRCCRAAGAVVAFVPEERAAGRGLPTWIIWLDDSRRKVVQWIHTAQRVSRTTTKQLLRELLFVLSSKGQMTRPGTANFIQLLCPSSSVPCIEHTAPDLLPHWLDFTRYGNLFLLNAATSNESPPDGPSSLRMGDSCVSRETQAHSAHTASSGAWLQMSLDRKRHKQKDIETLNFQQKKNFSVSVGRTTSCSTLFTDDYT